LMETRRRDTLSWGSNQQREPRWMMMLLEKRVAYYIDASIVIKNVLPFPNPNLH